jgi:hypothetical protein
MPIREVLEGENSAKLEMMINDGDMSFISSDDEDYRWIQDYIEGKIQLGLTTGCKDFDKHFLIKRDLTVINGISNIGKSTFSLYMIVYCGEPQLEVDYILSREPHSRGEDEAHPVRCQYAGQGDEWIRP